MLCAGPESCSLVEQWIVKNVGAATGQHQELRFLVCWFDPRFAVTVGACHFFLAKFENLERDGVHRPRRPETDLITTLLPSIA